MTQDGLHYTLQGDILVSYDTRCDTKVCHSDPAKRGRESLSASTAHKNKPSALFSGDMLGAMHLDVTQPLCHTECLKNTSVSLSAPTAHKNKPSALVKGTYSCLTTLDVTQDGLHYTLQGDTNDNIGILFYKDWHKIISFICFLIYVLIQYL